MILTPGNGGRMAATVHRLAIDAAPKKAARGSVADKIGHRWIARRF
jgi:hypothetical protein